MYIQKTTIIIIIIIDFIITARLINFDINHASRFDVRMYMCMQVVNNLHAAESVDASVVYYRSCALLTLQQV